MRYVELLAPAKNLETGKAAILHGADAVYIGPSRYGARSQAGNSIDDIAALTRFAHQYGAKVYATVNTLVRDDEYADALQLLSDLDAVGVDAVLLQDMRFLPDYHFRMALHASTQADNRTAEKVRWLQDAGFSRAVLARELSIDDIRAIHKAVPDMELEVFVHGALCVSYSGQCYASEYCFGRSANRGECAQFCRLKFDLEDADGNVIERGRHFLSLRDMCRIDSLEELLDAGVVSLKIEGRLKDISYVKNVTAAYSQRLNAIIARHPDRYQRASKGRVEYTFTPNLDKTFNRGYTEYFLHGRTRDIFSPDTPKAIGEYVGKVKEIRGNSFNVAGTATFTNGDGLCFLNSDRELEGFRVNRAEGNRLFPLTMPRNLRPGMALYRNNDVAFDRLMAGNTADRRIPVTLTIGRCGDDKIYLSLNDGQRESRRDFPVTLEPAEKPQRDNIVRQLSRLGNTPYVCREVVINDNLDSCFIPSSMLAEMRRSLTE